MIPPILLIISLGWGLIDLPLRAAFSPAHPLARQDVPVTQGRADDFQYFPLREWPGRPRLRAWDEHCFIVRVLRARRAPGHSLPSF